MRLLIELLIEAQTIHSEEKVYFLSENSSETYKKLTKS